MNIQELRGKNLGELLVAQEDLFRETRELRFALATRESRTHRSYRAKKRAIAQIKTILREKESTLDGTKEKG